MSLPTVVTKDEWNAAREALLVQEKRLTRERDDLNRQRRELPMVEVTEDYALTGPTGPARLEDLFDGRRQLVLYHFMYDPSWDTGCSSCTAGTDEISPGLIEHLRVRDTAYALISRAPIEQLEAYKAERGWDLPWYSTAGTTFGEDFGTTVPDDDGNPMEVPSRSCWLRADGRTFLTYQQWARGLEASGGSYYFLDLTALGRQEDWEEPKGRSDDVRGNQPSFAS